MAAFPPEAHPAGNGAGRREERYSRYPVYRESVDQVVGYLHVLDIAGSPPDATILPFLRKTAVRSGADAVDGLLRSFPGGADSFAVVVD